MRVSRSSVGGITVISAGCLKAVLEGVYLKWRDRQLPLLVLSLLRVQFEWVGEALASAPLRPTVQEDSPERDVEEELLSRGQPAVRSRGRTGAGRLWLKMRVVGGR